MMRRDLHETEKAKYFAIWIRYVGTLLLSKSEQEERIKTYTGKSTIRECDAADLRKLLIGLQLNPDGPGATA